MTHVILDHDAELVRIVEAFLSKEHSIYETVARLVKLGGLK